MTHSAHRRRGLFEALALETYANASAADRGFAAFGFGGPTSTPGFLKMGWRIAVQVPYLVKPFPLTLMPEKDGRPGAAERLDRADARLISAMIQAKQDRDAHVERSAAFLAWRLANPIRTYIILRDDRAHAIVTRAGTSFFVIDFHQADPAAGRHVRAALRELSLSPRTKGLLTFCQPGSDLYRQLRGSGFIRNRLPWGPASGSVPLITFGAAPERWAVGPLDHDSY